MFESRVCGNGILSNGLYKLNVNEHVLFQSKSDNSLSPYALWHRRLGHGIEGWVISLCRE